MIHDAATVLLLRDEQAALEVFMLERHIESDFVGGAFVFPGGKVDESDVELESWSGIDPDGEADRFRSSPEMVLSLYIAAVRETFEEAGVLLATRAGEPIDPGFVASEDTQALRSRMASRGDTADWRPWLHENDLVLELGQLHWWSWWITPEGLPKRFDTRFFVAEVPVGQVAEHDDVETTDSQWMRPGEALVAAERGDVQIILPTRRNLVDLAQFPSVETVIRDARGRNPGPILPRIVPFEGGLAVDHDSFEGPETV